ncbi:MAG: DUF6175 family protein [Chitinispirillales bacterium]|nr:DUF6175 family protein [Chitinispirillales bacterium]
MKKLMMLMLVFVIFNFAGATNIPMSKQAALVEVYSSSEISLNATGFGNNEKTALTDLQRAAVWFALYNGTDPLLNNDAAKAKFEPYQESFFELSNVSKFITFEAQKVISSTKTTLPDKRKGFKVIKNIRVNVSAIRSDLEGMGVLASKDALVAQIGLPFIMVIPETPKGQTPLQVFESNPLARQAAGVIESFLTARKYDVIVPRASEQLNDLANIQAELKGADQDISYQLSLALGADVYISFSGSVQGGKATVVVKAYETTTARLLGTETGYSATRPNVAQEALVEEAINGAIQNVLARVTAYWQDDVKRGAQYKLIFNVTGNFNAKQIENLQFAVSDVIEEMFSSSKENIVADKTMDYLVWAKNSEYSRSMNIFRDIKSKLAKEADVTRININRKLIILGLDNL